MLVRDHEEHHEQMAQMMQIIMRIARKKGTVNDANFVNTVARTHQVTEGLVNPPTNSVNLDVGASHHSIPPLTNVNPKIYPPPPTSMPLGGVYTYPYTYPYMPPLQSSEELKEQERKKLEMMMQSECGNTQQKVNLQKKG